MNLRFIAVATDGYGYNFANGLGFSEGDYGDCYGGAITPGIGSLRGDGSTVGRYDNYDRSDSYGDGGEE